MEARRAFGLRAHREQLLPVKFPNDGVARRVVKKARHEEAPPVVAAAEPEPEPEPEPEEAAGEEDGEALRVTFERFGLPEAERLARRYGIASLYRWQREALACGGGAALQGGSLVYSAPASGGKTTMQRTCP